MERSRVGLTPIAVPAVLGLSGTIAAFEVNLGVVCVTFCAGSASLIGAAGFMSGAPGLVHTAGVDFFIAACFAVYTGAAGPGARAPEGHSRPEPSWDQRES